MQRRKSYLTVVQKGRELRVYNKFPRRKLMLSICVYPQERDLGNDTLTLSNCFSMFRVPLTGSYYMGIAKEYTLSIHKDYIQNASPESIVMGKLLFCVDMDAEGLEGEPANNDWLIYVDFRKHLVTIWDHKKKNNFNLKLLR